MGKFDVTIPDDMAAIIDKYSLGLGVGGFVMGSVGSAADNLVLAPAWLIMTNALVKKAGLTLSKAQVEQLSEAVLSGAAVFLVGKKLASTIFGWLGALFTFGGTLVLSSSANAAMNIALTAAYGRSIAKYILVGGDLNDIRGAVPILIALTGRHYGFKTPFDSKL